MGLSIKDVGIFLRFLIPTPPPVLKNADVVNGWSLFRNSNRYRYSMTYREMKRFLIVVDEL